METIALSNGQIIERKSFTDYSLDDLKRIIASCRNITNVMKTLKLNKFYHRIIKEYIQNNNIDISHFEKTTIIRKIENYLIKDSGGFSSASIKKYLFKNNILKNECSECKLQSIWNNKPIMLQLDHINGDHYDNRIENLRILCPNCHSQSDTFTGRNLRQYKVKKCVTCEKILKKDNTTGKCAECIGKEKHLCSVCKINNKNGHNSKCKTCLNKVLDVKLCKSCNKEIKRVTNITDYHKKCYKISKI